MKGRFANAARLSLTSAKHSGRSDVVGGSPPTRERSTAMSKRIARRAAAVGAGIALMLAAAAPAVADGGSAHAAAARSLQADFDNDGFADLAVGAPGEGIGSSNNAGAVSVLYGSGDGLTGTGSQLFTQNTPGVGGNAETDDNFGSTLAAGDFDNDNADDLAIGAPFESLAGNAVAGAVNVFYGSASGLTGSGSQLFTQDTPGVGGNAEGGDFFGLALAAGDFDNDNADDLAIGAPFESLGSNAVAGAVNVLYGSAGGLTGSGSQLFTQDTPGVGGDAERLDEFGRTLAAGDFNNDGADDLAIGVPSEAIGTIELAGAVNVLYGSTGGLTAAGSQLFTQNTPGVGGNAEDADLFGDALAAGDFNNDDADDLAIAASQETVGSIPFTGAVNVLYGSTGGLTATGSQLFTQDTPGVGGSAEETDGFGSALTAGDFNNNGSADLAVGVPNDNVGSILSAGAVNVLYGSANRLTGSGSQLFSQNSPGVGGDAESGDLFGWALAASGPQPAPASSASSTESSSEAERTQRQ